MTLAKTIRRIARRSTGVAWDVASEGLALALTRYGYALTAMPQFYPDVMAVRAKIAREDGTPMAHGHVLTRREREQAVRTILLSS